MSNPRREKYLARQAEIRRMRSEGASRIEISEELDVSSRVVANALRFFDETERECAWDSEPHTASDHRECRLRRYNEKED